MHKLLSLMVLLMSFNLWAGDKYSFTNAICDGKEVNIFMDVRSGKMDIDILSATKAEIIMYLRVRSRGLPLKVTMKTPVKFVAVTDDLYILEQDGRHTCQTWILGKAIDCTKENQARIPQGEFKMNKTPKSLVLDFQNYTGENISCSDYTLNYISKR